MKSNTIGGFFALALLAFGSPTGSIFAESAEQPKPAAETISTPASPHWSRERLDTTVGADYLTAQEREVIIELNMLRSDPAMYARNYLIPLRAYYDGKLLKYPGAIPIATTEGAAPLEECIRELESAKPAPLLSPRKGLVLAARDHVADQSRSGATGHTGGDGSSTVVRIDRYGTWHTTAGENIGYGYDETRNIVTALLIDDGVPSRGHRTNLLNGKFNVVGVGVGRHQVYRHMCVMDFAGGYDSK